MVADIRGPVTLGLLAPIFSSVIAVRVTLRRRFCGRCVKEKSEASVHLCSKPLVRIMEGRVYDN